jgi:uracil-DNA glycosylase family 4
MTIQTTKNVYHYSLPSVIPEGIKVNRTRLCPPEGSLDSDILFLAEAPGADEVVHSRPLIGRSGDVFNTGIQQAGINRSRCYLTNVVKERPMNNKIEQFINLKNKVPVISPEFHFWLDELDKEISNFQGNIIVAMGNIALHAVTGLTGVMKRRGSMYWSDKYQKKVMASLHPSFAARQYIWRHIFKLDMKRALDQSTFPELRLTKRDYIIQPTFAQCKAYLEAINHKVAFDIEVIRGEVSCISFSSSKHHAISIPFYENGRNYFSLDQEMELWTLINKVLSDPMIKKIGQNLSFDTNFLMGKYGILTRNLDDTMLATKLFFTDFPMGLDFITSTRTDLPYYKDEGKQYMKDPTNDRVFMEYNAKDSIVCYEAMEPLKQDLADLGNLDTYEMHIDLIEPCIYMGQRGLRVDLENMKHAEKGLIIEIDELQAKLNESVGGELNVNSPKQCKDHFYIKRNFPPYRKAGSISVDETALKRMARKKGKKGADEAKMVLDLRGKRKALSTYFQTDFRDGRLVCSYRPITSMGRLASSKTIDGFGMNMQNWPKSFNKYFLPDPGYYIFNVDLAKADVWSVAFLAEDERMMDALLNDLDMHSLTASILFPEFTPQELKQMDKDNIKCQLGYGDQSHRYWGKKANHALNFGMGYKKFALMNELPEAEGRRIWSAYHRAYPSVSQVFHARIQEDLRRKNRILTNTFGRKCLFLDRWGEDLFNKAYAFIPQSNTADIINRQGVIPFYYEEEFKEVELLRQVHDSINFQISKSVGIKGIANILRRMRETLEQPLTIRGRTFVVPAEFSIGLNLYDQTDLFIDPSLEQQLLNFERDIGDAPVGRESLIDSIYSFEEEDSPNDFDYAV